VCPDYGSLRICPTCHQIQPLPATGFEGLPVPLFPGLNPTPLRDEHGEAVASVLVGHPIACANDSVKPGPVDRPLTCVYESYAGENVSLICYTILITLQHKPHASQA
jgi:hypothetical protein